MDATRREFLKVAAVAGAAATVLRTPSSLAAAARVRPADPKKLLILGGTAFLGPELVDAAKQRGWTITLFNRGKTKPQLFPDLEKLRGDRKTDISALKDRDWDYVVDTSAYIPREVKMSAELLSGHVKQYVLISTISVYGMSVPNANMDETAAVEKLPEGADLENLSNMTYGPLKALCEAEAEKAMPGRATVIRPGLIVGPGDPTDRFTYWPVRVAKGGKVLAPGTPKDPVQYVDVRDLAEFALRTLESQSVGIYNAVGPKGGMPIGDMLDACKRAAKSDAEFVWASEEFLGENQVAPWSDMPVWVPTSGQTAGFHQFNIAKAVGAGLTFRLIEDTARDTLKWWNEQPEGRRAKLRAGITAEREATLLAALKK